MAMHHLSQNQERSLACQSYLCPNLVSFSVLSHIKPQNPHHGGAFPSILLSFKLAIILPLESKNLVSRGFPNNLGKGFTGISSWYSLWLELQRYLIIFDPLTLVPHRQIRPRVQLSHQVITGGSLNFTSSPPVWYTWNNISFVSLTLEQ